MLLHFMHLLGVEVGRRVLGAVHNAGLQRLIDLGEGHHLRNRADGAHLRVEHLGGLDAHLLPLKSSGILSGLLALMTLKPLSQ